MTPRDIQEHESIFVLNRYQRHILRLLLGLYIQFLRLRLYFLLIIGSNTYILAPLNYMHGEKSTNTIQINRKRLRIG